jgi:signal transduction histidine kinase
MKSPSIRRTLLIRCGLGVGVLLCMLSTSIYLIVRHGLFRELNWSITQTAALLSNQVELENGVITFEWKEGVGTNKALHDDGLFQFWDETTGATTRSSQLKGLSLPKFCGENGAPELKEIELPGSGREAHAIGMRIYPFVLPEEAERMKARGHVIDPKTLPHILVVARDTKSMYRVLNRTRWVLGAGTLLTLALGFVVIHRAIRVTLSPIDELTLQMKDRAEHQLDSALQVPGALPVELAGLAKNFDSLLARVAAIRERERDFIRHAAHELRTPIAGLRATTDLALSQPRDAAAYAAHLATCQKTAVELGDLVKRLSALSRIGQPGAAPPREAVDVGNALQDCLAHFLPQFKERDLKIQSELPATPLVAVGDLTLLRVIFNNLFDNAVSYAKPDTTVAIHGDTVGGSVEIRISNEADELPENLERLFEPLFREDAARNNAGSHLGIGLTLSQEAATAMGATLRATRTDSGRIAFTLKLPPRGL